MILLDSHFAVWTMADPDRLTGRERKLIETQLTAVSTVSLWELRIKWNLRDAKGRRRGPVDAVLLLGELRARSVRVLHLTPEVAVATLRVPLAHKDPFDELLLIHAQTVGARLLTRDARLLAHPLALTA